MDVDDMVEETTEVGEEELEAVVAVAQKATGSFLNDGEEVDWVGVAELVDKLDLAKEDLVAQNKTGFWLEDVEDQFGLLVISS